MNRHSHHLPTLPGHITGHRVHTGLDNGNPYLALHEAGRSAATERHIKIAVTPKDLRALAAMFLLTAETAETAEITTP